MVISIVMVIVGIVVLQRLPVALFPDITPPQIMISAMFPGGDAKTIEESVTAPIEQQVTGVDHMQYMTSTSANNGMASITVTFDIETDPDVNQILTQLRTSQAAPQLPAEVNMTGLVVQKSLSSPLMFINLISPDDSRDPIFLTNYANISMVDELTRVAGVGRVQVFGAGQYAMRVWVKPDQLAKLGVTVSDVINAIQEQNRVNPAGKIGAEPGPPGKQFTLTVMAQGRFTTPEEFERIILRSERDGSTLRLGDVARVEMGSQSYDTVTRSNGRASTALAIYQLPGSNAVDTALGVKAKLKELEARFPKGVALILTLDTTKNITQGIYEIVETLGIALLLVVLVVYLFLQSWRATLIPMLAVPVSLVGTFIVFPLLGFSVNTLSLFGMVLAIGLVVDDAIVVVEAVEHHIEKGLSPREASLQAMREVSGPVVAIALILAAVFVPTAFIPGITGRLYQQFAITIAISVAISAFNALSLSPAMCTLLLSRNKASHGRFEWFFEWFNRSFKAGTDRYIAISRGMIRKMALSLGLLAAVTVLGVGVGASLPTSFLPDEDQGYLLLVMQMPHASSLERTSEAAQKIGDRIKGIPGIANIVSVSGFDLLGGVMNTYNGVFWITLDDWSERKAPHLQFKAIQGAVMGAISQVPDAIAFPLAPPPIPGVGNTGGFTFILEDRSGGDPAEFTANVNTFMNAIRQRKELAGVSSSYLPDIPQLYVNVDREKAARRASISAAFTTRCKPLWVAPRQLFQPLRPAVAGLCSGRGRVPNAGGGRVTVLCAEFRRRHGAAERLRRGQSAHRPGVQLPLQRIPGYADLRIGCPRLQFRTGDGGPEETFARTMPAQMGFDYSGMSYQEKRAAEGISPVTIYGLSILFVFLILAAQYESWSLPFSVLLVTPVAVLGAFLALWVRGFENDVYAQIGLVMLIGLSAKNAILIVEYAKRDYESGDSSIVDAALRAARLRLRPILMTAFAFILGCVPLAIASGSGAVSRQVLGSAVIGGMLAATIIAIFLIPVCFVFVERLMARFSRKTKAATLLEEGDPA